MIHRALKLIRQFNEIKQVELAEKLGISKSYLSEIESGRKTVSFELLERYAGIFDIDVTSLVFFSESIDKKSGLASKYKEVVSGKILDLMEWYVGSKNKSREAA